MTYTEILKVELETFQGIKYFVTWLCTRQLWVMVYARSA
jgi:hypothetical protein